MMSPHLHPGNRQTKETAQLTPGWRCGFLTNLCSKVATKAGMVIICYASYNRSLPVSERSNYSLY